MSELGNWLVDNTWLWTSLAALAVAVVAFLLATDGSDWAPLLVMGTVPIQREMLAGPDDAHLTFTQVALAAFFAGATIRFASGRLGLTVDAVTVLMGIVVSIFGLSIITSPDLGLWAAESYRWAVAGIFFVVARAYFTSASAMRILGVLATGIVVAAGLATTQVVSDDGPSSFVRSGLLRAHGWFGEPNPFAAFIWIVTLPVLAYVVFSGDRRRGLRAFAAASCLLGVGALVMTQSRGGLVGAGAGVCVIAALVLGRQCRQIRIVASLATAIVAALAMILLVRAEPWSASGEATTSASWANQERAAHWSAAVHMVEAHPIGGVGAGGFSDQFRKYTETWRFRISQGHAHNAYLQLAAEIGLPGLVAYGLMMVAILAAIIRRARIAQDSWLPIGAGAMTVALLTHQMVDFLHVLSLGLLFAGLWAASLPSGHKGKSSREHNFAS